MGKRILSVDDSSSMRQIIKSCLEKEGYTVDEAEDGVVALDRAKDDKHINLFLVDVNMPNMDGITLVRELRKLDHYKNTPIIMLTTEGQAEKKSEGQKAGANGWIVKPFQPNEFLKVISRLTG